MRDDLTNLSQLSQRLGHDFAAPELLRLALRHSSLSVSGPAGSNERYEFLGDRVFGLVIAEMLLNRFPNEDEGDIAKRHTALVRQEALARVAKNIGLGEFIDMSEGEENSGGRQNPSVLSDCCEAVIAALYIDGGLDTASDFIVAHWRDMIEETPEPPKDAKTALQEWAQGRGLPLPKYTEVSRDGPAHKPIFVIEASVEGKPSMQASGTSKQKAEQESAENLLKDLKNDG
jgi:ribonuclease III